MRNNGLLLDYQGQAAFFKMNHSMSGRIGSNSSLFHVEAVRLAEWTTADGNLCPKAGLSGSSDITDVDAIFRGGFGENLIEFIVAKLTQKGVQRRTE